MSTVDLKADIEKIAEDAAGVEFLGAVDVVESVGANLELVLHLGDILAEQVQLARDDYNKVGEELKNMRAMFDLVGVNNRHIERRFRHGISGVAQWNKALLAEQKKLLEMNMSLWGPFQKILKSDLHLG